MVSADIVTERIPSISFEVEVTYYTVLFVSASSTVL